MHTDAYLTLNPTRAVYSEGHKLGLAGDPMLPGQLGVKTFDFIKRGTLVTYYVGELISTDESDVRQKVSDWPLFAIT